MGRRVDVDDALAPVAIPGRVLNELCAHALETLPEECCGLIVEAENAVYGRVVRCRNEMTRMHREDPERWPRTGREGFYMHPDDYRPYLEGPAGVTAVYHSHVGFGVYLSDEDLAYAEHPFFPFPRAAQIVLAVHERVVQAQGIFRPGGSGFAGHRLEAAS